MKKHRLIPLFLSLLLCCTACSYNRRQDDPVSLQTPVAAEHPPQYSAALAEALADQPDGLGVLDQMYKYNEAYCLEDGMSAIEMWRS